MTYKPTYEELKQRVKALEKESAGYKQIKEKLQLHKQIMRNMAEGVVFVRVCDAVIVYANRKFEEMFGYGPGELNNKPVAIVNSEDENKSAQQITDEIIDQLTRYGEASYEIHNLKKDGTSFWCQAHTSTFNHAEYGEVWVAVHSDINERRKSEEELQKAHDELEQRVQRRTAELEEANRKLSEKTENLKELNSALKILLDQRE